MRDYIQCHKEIIILPITNHKWSRPNRPIGRKARLDAKPDTKQFQKSPPWLESYEPQPRDTLLFSLLTHRRTMSWSNIPSKLWSCKSCMHQPCCHTCILASFKIGPHIPLCMIITSSQYLLCDAFPAIGRTSGLEVNHHQILSWSYQP